MFFWGALVYHPQSWSVYGRVSHSPGWSHSCWSCWRCGEHEHVGALGEVPELPGSSWGIGAIPKKNPPKLIGDHPWWLLWNYIVLGKFHHDLTVLPNPGIMVKKRNYPKMAQLFRVVNYYNLPRLLKWNKSTDPMPGHFFCCMVTWMAITRKETPIRPGSPWWPPSTSPSSLLKSWTTQMLRMGLTLRWCFFCKNLHLCQGKAVPGYKNI